MLNMTNTAGLYSSTKIALKGRSFSAILLPSCMDQLFDMPGTSSIWHSQGYHHALEQSFESRSIRNRVDRTSLTPWYVRLEENNQPVGMLFFQSGEVNLGESLRRQPDHSGLKSLRNNLISRISVRTLCLGNTLVTGEYGSHFTEDIPVSQQTKLIIKVIDWLLTLAPFENTHIVLLKDFYADIFQGIQDEPCCRLYHAVETQPNMVLTVQPQWASFQDYLDALKSKYRVRARKAIETGKIIRKYELDAHDIAQKEDTLYRLYLHVVQDAGFSLFKLPDNYFSVLKQNLGDDFRLWMYCIGEEPVAFYSLIRSGDELNAHFLGFDQQKNLTYKLYFNILMDLVSHAIDHQYSRLVLSRTAMEIKSSVGAVGVPMWTYIRHTRQRYNWMAPLIYRLLMPELSWVPRQPFRGTDD